MVGVMKLHPSHDTCLAPSCPDNNIISLFHMVISEEEVAIWHKQVLVWYICECMVKVVNINSSIKEYTHGHKIWLPVKYCIWWVCHMKPLHGPKRSYEPFQTTWVSWRLWKLIHRGWRGSTKTSPLHGHGPIHSTITSFNHSRVYGSQKTTIHMLYHNSLFFLIFFFFFLFWTFATYEFT